MASRDPGPQAPSLRHAELRLVLLLEDLERAVESADKLASAGLEEEAIRIIDLQRDALRRLPDQIATDLAPRKPSIMRRIAVGAAAAALTGVAVVSAGLGLIGDEPMTPEAVTRKIATAERLQNPAQKLDSLEEAMVEIQTLKTDLVTVRTLSERVEQAARRFPDDHPSHQHDTLGRRAERLAQQARAQAPAQGEATTPVEKATQETLDLFGKAGG